MIISRKKVTEALNHQCRILSSQPIILSTRQQALLEQIANRTTNSYNLVTRAKLILGAARGMNNTALSQQLQLHRRRVRMWRQQWLKAGEQLARALIRGGE